MSSDSSCGFFFSFPTRGITHFITYTQNTTERVEEKEQTNKHGLGSTPSARKGVCDTLHSLSICRLSRACILRETSTKATRNANSSLTVFPHCLLLLTILPLDYYLKLTVLLCCPLSTASLRPPFVIWPSFFPGTFLSSSTSGLARDLTVRPFVWVSRQSRQRDSLTCARAHARIHTHTHTQHNK